MSSLDDWTRIARENFLDNRFYNWLEVNKTFNLFKNANLPLSEDSYLTFTAIIDALLLQHLHSSQCKFLNAKKIASLILQFDVILLKFMSCNERSKIGFKLLDHLAKCLLYTRIGDFVFTCLHADNITSSEKRQKINLAIYAYTLAYEWALKGLEIDADVYQNLSAVLSLVALELHTLISKNFSLSADYCSLSSFNNFTIISFINSLAKPFGSSRVCKADEENSFILSDQTIVERNGDDYFDITHRLIQAWPLWKNVYFLRRLAWLISECFESRGEIIFDFVDEVFNHLPECPDDPHDAGSPESLSKADVKIFLFRLSQHLKLNSTFDCTLPWFFFRKSNTNQQLFWDSLVMQNEEREYHSCLKTLMEITNTLEQIRNPDVDADSQQGVYELIDSSHFIRRLRNFSKNENTRAFYSILLERYFNSFKAVIPENDWILVVEDESKDAEEIEAVPSTQDQDQCEIQQINNEEADYVAAENKAATPIEYAKSPETTTASTQTDVIYHQQQYRMSTMIWELGQTNFYINRWICHNRALLKIFAKWR